LTSFLPKASSICSLPENSGQEARKQSCELFSNDWSRTVNLQASGSDAYANVTVSADRSELAIALAEPTQPEVREGFKPPLTPPKSLGGEYIEDVPKSLGGEYIEDAPKSLGGEFNSSEDNNVSLG